MRSAQYHNHGLLIAVPGVPGFKGESTVHEIMHIHPMPDDKGHTHEVVVGSATTTEEVPA